MELQTIPRAYVLLTLRTARLPLTALERFAGVDDDAAWPPLLAFDGFAAETKRVVGSLLHDPELEQQGRLGSTRVAELRDAMRLETLADRTRTDAEQSFAERRAADAQKRDAAKERAEQRKTEADRRRQKEKAKADADARAREERARQVEEDRERQLEKQERAAKRRAIGKERSALATTKAASDAKTEALAKDDELRTARAARKSAKG